MTAKPKKRWYRSTLLKAILAVAGLLLLVLGVGLWKLMPRGVKEFPRPPLPKAFPDCPEVETKAHSWRGLSFRAPADWRVEEDTEVLGWTVSSSGSAASKVPIQPLRCFPLCRVTNAPRFSSNPDISVSIAGVR